MSVLPDLEEQARITDMLFVVAIVAEEFKVVVVEDNRDVRDVFGCNVFLMVNYVTILFMATLAESAVYRTPFGNE